MSGICGIIQLDGARAEEGSVYAMAAAAPHRGPDGVAFHVDGPVGLAFLALHVSPESARERQPFVDGDISAVIDCRIDNRAELCRQLSELLPASEPTDAELVFAAYRRWGPDFPARILGDFAVAIWDGAARTLLLARDVLGARTIYHRVEPRRVLFATEVKQILAAPGVPRRIFEPAVAVHLSDEAGSAEWSFFEGVSQLPAAHALIVHADGRARLWRYWDVDPEQRIDYADDREYAEHFRELFGEAVRCRLRSVKPAGIFLSGGLDSCSVAATAGWLRRRDERLPALHAYCFVFDELASADERRISDGLVAAYDLPVTYVPADDAWPLKSYPAYGPDPDDPMTGAFQVLHERGLGMAKSDGLGLMFTGAHGDAMIGGNVFAYPEQLMAGQWRALWRDLRAHRVAEGVGVTRLAASRVTAPLLRSVWPKHRAAPIRQAARRALRRPPPWPEWLRPDLARRVGLGGILAAEAHVPRLSSQPRRRRYEISTSVWEQRGETWNERNFARYGLQRADPYQDRRVLEFVLAVPARVLNRPGPAGLKWLSREAMRGVMPEDVRRTAAKIIPAPLYIRGVREKERDVVFDLLTNMRAHRLGYVDAASLRRHYEATLSGAEESSSLYSALSLEWWLRCHWENMA